MKRLVLLAAAAVGGFAIGGPFVIGLAMRKLIDDFDTDSLEAEFDDDEYGWELALLASLLDVDDAAE